MWAPTSTVRILTALLYPLNRDGLLWVNTAMAVVNNLPSPINQQGIDRIEKLLDDLDAIEQSISKESPRTGLIRANNVEWSDRGAGYGLYRQRDWIRAQISAALGLAIYSSSSSRSGNILCRS
jgi:hypothetical protein